MDPKEIDPKDDSSSIHDDEDRYLGPESKLPSKQMDLKEFLDADRSASAATSPGLASPDPSYAAGSSTASNQLLGGSDQTKSQPASYFNVPKFTITEELEEDLDPMAGGPPAKSQKTTRFMIPEDDEDAVSLRSINRTPIANERRPTPYFAEGIKPSTEVISDAGSHGDNESQTSSSRAHHLMISQKMMDKLAYFDSSQDGNMTSDESLRLKPLPYMDGDKNILTEKPKKKSRYRRGTKWYNRYSTRTRILIVAAILCFIALALGLGIGLYEKEASNKPGPSATWIPAPGLTWQIQLSEPVTDPTYLFSAYETDLFTTNASDITALHQLGRRVICYFSAGTYENWRPDAKSFPNTALGNAVDGSVSQRWLDIRRKDVRNIMISRIQLAASKGCDGLDPDHVNGFEKTKGLTGFDLTSSDAVDYVKFLSDTAIKSKLSIGLRNSPSIATQVIDYVSWAVTENCVGYQECGFYQPYIQAGRAVLHIEYPDSNPLYNSSTRISSFLESVCRGNSTHLFSTLLKKTVLDDWYMDCPLYILSSEKESIEY